MKLRFGSTIFLTLATTTVLAVKQNKKLSVDRDDRLLRTGGKNGKSKSTTEEEFCWGDPETMAFSSLVELFKTDACEAVGGTSADGSVPSCIASGGHAIVPFQLNDSNGRWLRCCDPCALDRELIRAQCTPQVGGSGPDRGCADNTDFSGLSVVIMVAGVSDTIGDLAYCCPMPVAANIF